MGQLIGLKSDIQGVIIVKNAIRNIGIQPTNLDYPQVQNLHTTPIPTNTTPPEGKGIYPYRNI
jgi:hypothetical protein